MPLTDILQATIEKARSLDNAGADTSLPHGLHIHIRKTDGYLMLTIWRLSVDPSAREWNTVIAHWPWPLGAINWSNNGVTESGKHFKQVGIPLKDIP